MISETGMFIETEFYLNFRKLATFPAVYFALFLFLISFALIDRALEKIVKVFKKRRSTKIDNFKLRAELMQSKRQDLVRDK